MAHTDTVNSLNDTIQYNTILCTNEEQEREGPFNQTVPCQSLRYKLRLFKPILKLKQEKRRQDQKRKYQSAVGVANKATLSEHVQTESRCLCIRRVNLKLFEVVMVEKVNCLC
jgi:hypothetical protein